LEKKKIIGIAEPITNVFAMPKTFADAHVIALLKKKKI
jgi:hypothetical protein